MDHKIFLLLSTLLSCQLLSMTGAAIMDRRPNKNSENEDTECAASFDSLDSSPSVLLMSTDKDFRQYATDLQNSYRKKHGVDPLTLDAQLSDEAQKFADERVLTDDGVSLAEKLNNRYGLLTLQNDGKAPLLEPTEAVRKAVQFWYSTVSGYDWTSPLTSTSTANLFSQIVWKSTMRVGIGFAVAENRSVVVMFYDPPGNEQTEDSYKDNVLPVVQ